MRVRLTGPMWDVELVPWYEPEPERVHPDSRALMDAVERDPALLAQLRQLADDVDPTASERASDVETLCIEVARMIASGLIRAESKRVAPMVSDPIQRVEPVLPPVPIEEHDEDHWIELVVIGEDDAGIAGVRCEVTLPDGKVIQKTTSRDGLVRIEGIASAGDCTVRFPELDAEAWESA